MPLQTFPEAEAAVTFRAQDVPLAVRRGAQKPLIRPMFAGRVTVAFVLSVQLLAAPSQAETRRQCELALREQTRTATTSGLAGATGGLGGAVVAASACAGFLGVALLDLGLSFGACVTAVTAFGTAAGAIAGTAIAEEQNKRDLQRCAELSG